MQITSPTPPPPIVMSFAASDPSGGAGLQADILTIASIGCHPLSVVTAITVQDTTGVENMLAMDSDWVSDQARALLEDMKVGAFKIGVLGSVENVAAVAEIISDYPEVPLILDPVLSSGRGDELANEELLSAICELLVPQATIVIPNSLEARRLALEEDEEDPGLAECAQILIDNGAEFVLITGTHENTLQVINTLYDANGIVCTDAYERLPGSYHGSGCTLASAVAAHLAKGLDVDEAVQRAQKFTWQTLAKGFRPGMGQFIPDRFYWRHEAADDTSSS